jgi:hypothetical protein
MDAVGRVVTEGQTPGPLLTLRRSSDVVQRAAIIVIRPARACVIGPHYDQSRQRRSATDLREPAVWASVSWWVWTSGDSLLINRSQVLGEGLIPASHDDDHSPEKKAIT